jgi:predicted esterase
MRVAALLLALPVFTASESKKSGWVADLTGGISCWRNADTDESHGCDTSGGDKGNKAGSGEDSDKTWDKAPPQPPATPPRPSLPPGMSRPKILCLHGGGGSAEGFRMQANSLTQAMPGLDFVFLSAPNTGGVWMPDPPSSGGSKGSSTDPNWDSASAALLDGVVQEQGPFYGILGYSQGAAYAISYLSHAPAATFQLAALFSGYLPSTHLGILARINARTRPGGTRRLVGPRAAS